jgi:hypothetical protein
MKSPEPIRETTPSSRVPKEAVRLMLVILIAMSLLALYANVQELRRAKIEEVQVTPYSVSSTAPEVH